MRRVFSIFASHGSFSLILLLFLFQPGESFAQVANGEVVNVKKATLQEYRENIKHVNTDLSSFYSLAAEDFDKDWSMQDQLDFEKDFYAEVPQLLPPRQTVEWQGAQTEVDNRWLHKRLEELKKLSIHSPDRNPIINELSERLTALEARLKELDTLPAATRSKDEEKQKLSEILNRVEYQSPDKKDKSALERWWEGFLKWLQGLFPQHQPIKPSEPVSAPGITPAIVQIFIIILALAAITFVIWRVVPLFLNRRRRKKDKKENGDRVILGEKLAVDESSVSLFRQAELLAQEGNFRGAIRKGYIALLCELGDRKIVRLAQHKTNRDYLRDVSKNSELHGGVRDLTFMFENHWYGLASATEEEWGAFRENYRYSTSKI
jgi:hypothetical protein